MGAIKLSEQRKRSLMLALSLISVAIFSLSWTTSGVTAQGGQTCHLRELDLCAATLVMFSQSPGGMATSDQEINKQCERLRESDTCVRNYTKRCMTPMQREVLEFAANASLQMVVEYCTKGSALRTSYLKHSKCLNEVQKKDQKPCIKDFQVALELLTSGSGDQSKRGQLGCCTYNKLQTCLATSIEKRCGKETLKFVDGVVHRVTSRVPETVCRAQKPDSAECKALLPKPGTTPKGAKSSSILSRLLSAFTGF